jgi:tRNA dimethylallyltransferase
MDERPIRLFIVGPTASGKGRLSVEIALAAGGEVISVDSMKVYRGMDIGTAKPGAEARRGVPFHLQSIRDPHERMSAAEFVREAERVEAEVRARGRLPIFEGGTALYVRALTEGVFEGPEADPALRARLEGEAREGGREGRLRLHARLAAVDPDAARRLHPNDVRRVVRALEVHEKTGRPISALQSQWTDFEGATREEALARAVASRRMYGLAWSKEALRARIDARVQRMFEEGFVGEARALLARPGGVSREAEQALGYRQLFAWVRAGLDPSALPAVREEIQRATRRYAKRQLTFWAHFPDIRWLACDERTQPPALAARILDELRSEGALA